MTSFQINNEIMVQNGYEQVFSRLSSWPYFSENMYVVTFCLELGMEVTNVIKHAGFIHKFLLKFLSIPNAFIMYSISFITPLGNKLNAIFVLHCV